MPSRLAPRLKSVWVCYCLAAFYLKSTNSSIVGCPIGDLTECQASRAVRAVAGQRCQGGSAEGVCGCAGGPEASSQREEDLGASAVAGPNNIMRLLESGDLGPCGPESELQPLAECGPHDGTSCTDANVFAGFNRDLS